ncbi:hypothetical protein R1flu_004111 [Riccia fluitans]|uniref:Uncharacterized protein n=1 Tax=Riccia fluitans TaxID=41844 RepID=A0ABD1YTB4_9MARC
MSGINLISFHITELDAGDPSGVAVELLAVVLLMTSLRGAAVSSIMVVSGVTKDDSLWTPAHKKSGSLCGALSVARSLTKNLRRVQDRSVDCWSLGTSVDHVEPFGSERIAPLCRERFKIMKAFYWFFISTSSSADSLTGGCTVSLLANDAGADIASQSPSSLKIVRIVHCQIWEREVGNAWIRV